MKIQRLFFWDGDTTTYVSTEPYNGADKYSVSVWCGDAHVTFSTNSKKMMGSTVLSKILRFFMVVFAVCAFACHILANLTDDQISKVRQTVLVLSLMFLSVMFLSMSAGG